MGATATHFERIARPLRTNDVPKVLEPVDDEGVGPASNSAIGRPRRAAHSRVVDGLQDLWYVVGAQTGQRFAQSGSRWRPTAHDQPRSRTHSAT